MQKKLYSKLKKQNKLHKLKCESGCHFYECPSCKNRENQYWGSKRGPIGLCYECGTLWVAAEDKTIKKCEGNPNSWESKALAEIHNINTHKELYKGKDLSRRKKEYVEFLKNAEGLNGSVEEVLDSCRVCDECGEEFYTKEEENWALLEFDSPEKSYEVLHEINENHAFNDYIKSDYEEVSLGEETWKSEKFVDVFVSPEMLDYLLTKISVEYCRWVLDGKLFILTHEFDPEWDCSGQLMDAGESKLDRLMYFGGVGDWLDEGYSGHSYPTHVAGYGLSHETFFDNVEELLFSELSRLWTKKLTIEEKNELLEDEGFIDDVVEMSIRVLEVVADMSVLEAWQRGHKQARKEIDEDKQKEAELRERHECWMEKAQQIWNKHFSDIKQKITKRNCGKFIDRLNKVLLLCAKEEIESLHYVGLPGEFSNSVNELIDEEVRKIYEK